MPAAYTKKLIVLFCISIMLCTGFVATQPAPTSPILTSSITKHLFSNPKTPDVFKLTIRGTVLLKATATVEIFTSTGTRIFTETFNSHDLVDELEANDFHWTIKQQEEQIKKRVREFFLEKNFSKTANDLSPTYQYDESPSKAIWAEFHADKTAIGFGYLLGYENHRMFAWSKKMKKVVEYWGCC